jgi:hypothetical protein
MTIAGPLHTGVAERLHLRNLRTSGTNVDADTVVNVVTEFQ